MVNIEKCNEKKLSSFIFDSFLGRFLGQECVFFLFFLFSFINFHLLEMRQGIMYCTDNLLTLQSKYPLSVDDLSSLLALPDQDYVGYCG